MIHGELPPVGGMFLIVWDEDHRPRAALHERTDLEFSRCLVTANGIAAAQGFPTRISSLQAGRHGKRIIPLPPEEWACRRMLIHHGLGRRAIAIPSKPSGDLT